MPRCVLSPGFTMFYRDDDFTDPWESPETIVLLHGSSESSLAWNGWVPSLARQFRVIRPDLRGFGQSTPMEVDHEWSFDEFARDIEILVDSLGIDRIHIAGAKLGGPMALRFASTRPERVQTITLAGIPETAKALGTPEMHAQRRAQIEQHGVGSWARDTMKTRLGSDVSAEMLEGWTALMDATPVSTHLGFRRDIAQKVDIRADLPKIVCPTLVITTEGSGLGSVEHTRSWQQRIKNSELVVLPGDSYHVSATNPQACVQATLDFIARTRASQPNAVPAR